ncbi:GntR family transcriptional regulator [Cryptosporangium sp. NPDC051539]|uniref:GntR family transcriptional regulator n=1 Tax=Cryptosporangium sp. NPDC051539 TaxID=3363962 RepID=UPI0037AA7E65
MARTPTLVPGLRKIDLPEVRQAIPALHAYLRECVLDGTLVPGTKLSQVALADQLGVSRTPLREVLRMLQEEGLVEIEPNQRTRVAGLDPEELDEVYASRILLETLALSMTLDSFTVKDQRRAKAMLTSMRRAAKASDFRQWFESHGEFHRILTAGAGPSLRRQLTAYGDRSIRYIRIYQLADPTSWQTAGDLEHAAILESLTEHDGPAALSGLAHHLARTAERVLTDCAPGYEITAVTHALRLVDHQPDHQPDH